LKQHSTHVDYTNSAAQVQHSTASGALHAQHRSIGRHTSDSMATFLQVPHLLRAAQRRGRCSVGGQGGAAHPTLEGRRGARRSRGARRRLQGRPTKTPVAATETTGAADGGLQATVIESGGFYIYTIITIALYTNITLIICLTDVTAFSWISYIFTTLSYVA
jgi:hypothetical protein